MFIPDSTIKEIKQKALLEEVIGKFTTLKKKGKDYEGECPFCNGKHFSVSPAKEIYKCWDCDKGGNNAITFLMDKENMDYPSALKWLADFYNILIPEDDKHKRKQHNGKAKAIKPVNKENTAEAAAPEQKGPTRSKGNFFKETLRSIGLTSGLNKVSVKWLNRASQSEDVPLLSEDEEGNIDFLVYDINGFVITYEKQNGSRHTLPYKVKRLKDPRLDSKGHMMKYVIPKGIGTRPFFPPNLLQKFQAKEKIHTLILTEGYKKAISGWLNGLDIIGLTSISTYTDKQTMQLHRDIIDLILACDVENVILLYDGDCRDISQKALDEGKDIHSRPNNFFSSARGIKELLKDYLKDHEISLYFSHVNSDVVKGHPKGLDDIYEAMTNENANLLIQPDDNTITKGKKYLQAKKQVDEELNTDLLAFSKPGHYFHKINISFGFQKLLTYLAIDNVNVFYQFHQERIKDKKFVFAGSQFRYNSEKNECEIIIPAAAKNYVRVGDDYFEKVKVPNKYKELEMQLHHRIKTTITDDHGKTFIGHIQKYKAFCNVPDHVNYLEIYHNCYNMYNRFEHEPEPGDCDITLAFLQHVFEEQYQLGLDYVQLLYQRPTQILPILCLVSKENNTGKSTFAKWLKEVFRQNMAIVGNADLSNDFNGFWSTKLIICCEEVFIDKKLIVERIKNLSTADRIIMNQKGRDQIEIEFFGHFILLTNNEDSFIHISEEDIRYWVRKLKRPVNDNIGMLKEMINEIPAFLHFLNQRQMSTTCDSRMWFYPSLLITDALKRVQANSKSMIEKEMRTKLQGMFIDFAENIIYMTVSDIRREFFNNRYEERYILEILRGKVQAEQYWEPIPNIPGNPTKSENRSFKTKRYSFSRWHTSYVDGGNNQEIRRVEIKGNGRPFVFLRPDFVPPEMNNGIYQDPETLALANPVPWWYYREGMLQNNIDLEIKPEQVNGMEEELPFPVYK